MILIGDQTAKMIDGKVEAFEDALLATALGEDREGVLALARSYAERAGFLIASLATMGSLTEPELDEEADELQELMFSASRWRSYGRAARFNFRAWLQVGTPPKRKWWRWR